MLWMLLQAPTMQQAISHPQQKDAAWMLPSQSALLQAPLDLCVYGLPTPQRGHRSNIGEKRLWAQPLPKQLSPTSLKMLAKPRMQEVIL
jgi:hypothetical protein